METIEFKTNLRCSDCITRVAPFLDTVIGKEHWKVELDHPDKMVTVSVADPGDTIKVQAAFEKAGYTAEPL